MGTVALVLLVGAVVWGARLAWWPYGPCWLCGGNRRNFGSKRKRYGKCPACKGSGERWRLGARTVHKMLRRGR